MLINQCCDCGADGVIVTDIDVHIFSHATGVGHEFDRIRAFGILHVGDDHARAFGAKDLRRRATNAGTATGNEYYFILQQCHCRAPQ